MTVSHPINPAALSAQDHVELAQAALQRAATRAQLRERIRAAAHGALTADDIEQAINDLQLARDTESELTGSDPF